jgi:hypothetical protein
MTVSYFREFIKRELKLDDKKAEELEAIYDEAEKAMLQTTKNLAKLISALSRLPVEKETKIALLNATFLGFWGWILHELVHPSSYGNAVRLLIDAMDIKLPSSKKEEVGYY